MDKPCGNLRLLMLEDTPADVELTVRQLRVDGLEFAFQAVETEPDFVKAMLEFSPDVVVSDYRLPAFSGRAAIEYVRSNYPQTPIIILTGALGDEAAVELIKLGAQDYVLKEHLQKLSYVIKRALHEKTLETGYRAAIQARERLFRITSLLNQCDSLLIRSVNEIELLEGICRLMVDKGGYLMAWAGYAREDDAKTIQPIAKSGNEAGYIDTVKLTWADVPHGRGPAGTAIRSGEMVVNQNSQTNPAYLPEWREAASQHGFNSSIAIPLKVRGKVIGVFSAYSSESNAFFEGETELLEKLVADINYGIEALRTQAENKAAQAALLNMAREIEDLYDNAPCGYHSIDKNGILVRVNKTELDWLGYSRDEVEGKKHFTDLCTPKGRARFAGNLEELKRNGIMRDLEYDLIRKDGSILPVLLSATVVYDDKGRFLTSRSTIFDLTERKKLERSLKEQARTDPLTGIINRRYFHELAERELALSKRFSNPLAYMMIDIDHFKRVNDTYGHDVGDLVLQAMSRGCLQTLREIDVVGRWGGEEFVVMLPGVNCLQAREAAERLRIALQDIEIRLDDEKTIRFSVSIGTTCLESDDENVDLILKRADIALYAAKQSGRNCVRAYGLHVM